MYPAAYGAPDFLRQSRPAIRQGLSHLMHCRTHSAHVATLSRGQAAPTQPHPGASPQDTAPRCYARLRPLSVCFTITPLRCAWFRHMQPPFDDPPLLHFVAHVGSISGFFCMASFGLADGSQIQPTGQIPTRPQDRPVSALLHGFPTLRSARLPKPCNPNPPANRWAITSPLNRLFGTQTCSCLGILLNLIKKAA